MVFTVRDSSCGARKSLDFISSLTDVSLFTISVFNDQKHISSMMLIDIDGSEICE